MAWFEWLRDVWTNVKTQIVVVGATVGNHFVKFNTTGSTDLADSGKVVPSGEVVGTTDTQTLTNKTSPSYIITDAPTIDTHATNKKYVDDSDAALVIGSASIAYVDAAIIAAILADWEDEIHYWESYIEGYVLGYYDDNIKQWTEDYVAEQIAAAGHHPYFKVGDIAINTDGVNPGTKWGYGTWVCLGSGDWTLT